MTSRAGPLSDEAEESAALRNARNACDGKTFVVLNELYAQDKNFVYFRPQLVNRFDVSIVAGADPESFELVERCSPGHGLDSKHVYYMGEVQQDKDPVVFQTHDPNNAATWCY